MSDTLPDQITVTFTEEDRQKAERYTDICGCLLHTALLRMGVPVYCTGSEHVVVKTDEEEVTYEFPLMEFQFDQIRSFSARKPFYNESVVGKTLILTKA